MSSTKWNSYEPFHRKGSIIEEAKWPHAQLRNQEKAEWSILRNAACGYVEHHFKNHLHIVS